MHVMWETAKTTLRWKRVTTTGAKNPSYLFDTAANLAIGGGTVALGTGHFEMSYSKSLSAAPRFGSYQDFEKEISDTISRYNTGKTTYAGLVMGKVGQYKPQPLPGSSIFK